MRQSHLAGEASEVVIAEECGKLPRRRFAAFIKIVAFEHRREYVGSCTSGDRFD